MMRIGATFKGHVNEIGRSRVAVDVQAGLVASRTP